MSLFRKIFGIKSSSEKNIQNEERGKYMPQVKLPVDERFTINFKSNGGKFLYCETMEEVYQSLEHILEENNWENKRALVYDDRLKKLFSSFNFQSNKQSLDVDFFITTCEYLISDDGSLLISSNQIAEKKLKELPPNFIVYATTSQLVENIGDGLKGIKHKSHEKIPTNITTIKHFKAIEDKDFMSYGSSSKNLYLLLLEDL
ncbi:lactate utilization protein B/C [Paucihalobacter ruber]|uniref:Lactate utilization protein B/C n=1 Tax=Paucihalobacter ruber TaxID=2567861 RepID=A0A506PLP4_9FLAO|nr:LUD domain-containing protein [Paucihalobacter ruber]TPV34142.1 lactate utilization protein B/C [Paucihalobacter ruber]